MRCNLIWLFLFVIFLVFMRIEKQVHAYIGEDENGNHTFNSVKDIIDYSTQQVPDPMKTWQNRYFEYEIIRVIKTAFLIVVVVVLLYAIFKSFL